MLQIGHTDFTDFSDCLPKALTLSDGLKITAPVGAAFDEEEKAVCRSDGSVVAGEWVVIKGQNQVCDVNGDGSIDVADISTIVDAMAGKDVGQAFEPAYANCPDSYYLRFG